MLIYFMHYQEKKYDRQFYFNEFHNIIKKDTPAQVFYENFTNFPKTAFLKNNSGGCFCFFPKI